VISNFSRYSNLAVLDRQNLEKIIGETESGIYKSEADFIRLGEIAGIDYALTGSITKTRQGFWLNLTVMDTKTGLTAAAYSGACTAAKLENSSAVSKAARELIRQLKARPKRKPATAAGKDAWKYKRISAGARAGAALRNVTLNTNRDDIRAEARFAFEGGVQIECALLNFTLQKTPLQFSVQTELAFSTETVSASLPDETTTTLEASALTVPLLAKIAWKPGNFYAAVFTGPAFALPLGLMAVTQKGNTEHFDFAPAAGWTAGAAAGIKFGPGVLFLDARYHGDFVYVRVNEIPQYRRQIFSLSAGYIFGFLNMEIK
jgi:hypothetical protein